MIYGSSSLEHQTLRDFEMPSESSFRDIWLPFGYSLPYTSEPYLHFIFTPKLSCLFPKCFNYLAVINMNPVFCAFLTCTIHECCNIFITAHGVSVCLSMGVPVHGPKVGSYHLTEMPSCLFTFQWDRVLASATCTVSSSLRYSRWK